MVARVLLVVAALAAAGFLAVQERAARATDRITAAAIADPDPARLAAARAALPTAERWNPDTIAAQDLATAEARAGQYEQAGERLLAVTRKEPENARPFQLLCSIAKRYDSDLAGTACARLRVLAPPVGSLNRSNGRSTR
jgi:Flp pilus assembly protein CpaB